MSKRTLSISLKIGVSTALLAYCFSRVGWHDLWAEIAGANALFLGLYIGVSFLATIASSFKWHVLSTAHGLSASRGRLTLLYMVGYFFNNILPTSIGGDVVRAYELGKTDGKPAEAMASVFMERFTGLTALIIFAGVAVALDPHFLGDIKLTVALAMVCVAYLGVIALVFQRTILQMLQQRLQWPLAQRILRKMQKLQEAILLYRHQRWALLVSMLYSFVFYLISVWIVYTGCLTFGVAPSLTALFLVVPIMHILFMIPISLGGIGLQEWAYTAVLGMIGVSGAVGLSVALLYRARTILFGLIGGALYPLCSRTWPELDRTTTSTVPMQAQESMRTE
ncbi:lysylphosphatidylglycerol synthase transmembrane domain-containing protein [Candidatus Entotheonella palauensis]|uniref:lysylphosphatidylglycerol synthase transmembrane domain-containing protein n=1 Tax=Candidatus Entotheonella palauensis TaxID=93172 RepID=UPI0015C477F6|nr:lysylphosphatidylglycerol synthase transmembrane domain-containing protein [Candidatus Entotheonella palauensis]